MVLTGIFTLHSVLIHYNSYCLTESLYITLDLLFFFLLESYSITIPCRFQVYSKVIQIYTYMFFFRFLSLIGY